MQEKERAGFVLYIKTGCPHSLRVMERMRELGLSWQEKNVAETGIALELIARGGRKQEPYFVDLKNGIEMYEADNIIEYLNDEYDKKTKTDSR